MKEGQNKKHQKDGIKKKSGCLPEEFFPIRKGS